MYKNTITIEEYKKTSKSKGLPKYRNQKQKTKQGDFDSKKEHLRYGELKILEEAGIISALQTQVWFEVVPRQVDKLTGKVTERASRYIADFVYMQDGKMVVEDTKSPITRMEPSYVLKRKLMLLVHGIKIVEL
jgi:hypothetical protein